MKVYLILYALCFFSSCTFSQKRDANGVRDTSSYQSSLHPLEVGEHTTIRNVFNREDSSYLSIRIKKGTLYVSLFGDSSQVDRIGLDEFIQNKKKLNKKKVVVFNESDGSSQKLKEVLEILKKHDIGRFEMVTE